MTQQWQLSGNAENVDWSDLAMAGRAYADNLVGEPAVSKVMHMMADEIERLRAVIHPVSYAKNDENRVLYDTKGPRSGALSGCETVPDPDSRVWETPCTPPPYATPTQGSVQGEGSFRVSQNAKEPVAWAVMVDGERMYVSTRKVQCEEQAYYYGFAASVVPLYRHPQPTLTDAEREAVEWAESHFLSDYEQLREPCDKERSAALRGLLERLGGER